LTIGPNPQPFKLKPERFVFGNEAGARISAVENRLKNTHKVHAGRSGDQMIRVHFV